MKKILFIISIFVFLLSFSSVFAANIVISPQKVMVNGVQKSFEVYNIDGNNFFKLRDIAYVLNNTTSQFSVDYNTEKQMIEINKSKSYVSVGGELVTGTDKSSTAVKSSQKLSIDNAEKDLTAYNIGGNNFFKLRELGTELDFNVDFDADNNMVVIKSKEEEKVANITNVVAKIFEGIMYVEVTTDSPMDSYNVFSLVEPDRIILDMSNTNLKITSNVVNANYAGVTTVRMGHQGDNVNRVVIDLEKASDYKVVQSDDKKITCVALSKTFAYDDLTKTPENVLLVYNGSIISLPGIDRPSNSDDGKAPEKNEELPENVSGEVASGDDVINKDDSGDAKKELTEEELKNRNKITSIKYSSSTNKLKIKGNKDIEYESFTLENPQRIIVDIKNAVLEVEGPKSITPNNKNISEIRFSQNDIDIVRVVFDLKSEAEYDLTEKGKTLEVELEENGKDKVQYEVGSKYATFTLYDVSKNVFKTSSSSRKNTYTLTYSTSKFNPEQESLDIDDDYVESIEIESGKIIIKGAGETDFSIKKDGDNVVVKMKLESSEEQDFIVLLDAGHGGSDPGACNGTAYEKIYNLSVMLKLKEMLEDDGITVHCSRADDTYIDRDGRVEFATSYDDADLFVSVHHNSMANKNYHGTMVLYYDNVYEKDYGITSKEFAAIVQENLIEDLGTKNWGTVSRDDLYVLFYSELPSILCEIAFVSNDEELARIQTDEFQETAARAIYNGILEAKEQMGK